MSQDKNEQKQPAAEQAAPVEEVKTEQTAAPAEEQTTFTLVSYTHLTLPTNREV